MIQKQRRRSDEEWMALIQECRTSGLSDLAWCSEHGIPSSTFYNRISRLRKKACDIPMPIGHAIQSQQIVPLAIMEAPLQQRILTKYRGQKCLTIYPQLLYSSMAAG